MTNDRKLWVFSDRHFLLGNLHGSHASALRHSGHETRDNDKLAIINYVQFNTTDLSQITFTMMMCLGRHN